MTYRTRLLLVFIGVAIITNAISLGVLERLSRHYFYDGYRAKMLSIAATTGTMLDGDALSTIQTRDDEAKPAYSELRRTLRRVRDANRRPDTQMKRVFTVVRSKNDPNVLVIAIDPEENPEMLAHAGEVYRPGSRHLDDIDKPIVEQNFTTDEFGTFLRSWAPIRDHAGALVGGRDCRGTR